MSASGGDFVLTTDELRVVTRFVAETAEDLLPVFESVVEDPRPRAAVEAAWLFVDGEPRTKHQRTTSLDAHRAAAAAPTEVTRLAAQAAGDAASAAYLHPIAKATQVGHVLRAAANAARIAELRSPEDPAAPRSALELARSRATPALLDVLRRYPSAPARGGRVSRLMGDLDAALRRS